ncbi:MAG: hypothetical protein ABW321_22030 [Polyangiales bacterium]
MRCISPWLTLLAGLALASCAQDEDWRDKNRPDTFWDSCTPAENSCAEPFTCLAVADLTARVCTKACESNEDCPRWQATGHCAGSFQSKCYEGTCAYGCE